jgi:hypothetical protein
MMLRERPLGGFVFDNKTIDVWNRSTVTWCLVVVARSGPRRQQQSADPEP